MTQGSVNVNLTKINKLNIFKQLKNQIKQKNNKKTKMNQTKLGNYITN